MGFLNIFDYSIEQRAKFYVFRERDFSGTLIGPEACKNHFREYLKKNGEHLRDFDFSIFVRRLNHKGAKILDIFGHTIRDDRIDLLTTTEYERPTQKSSVGIEEIYLLETEALGRVRYERDVKKYLCTNFYSKLPISLKGKV